MEEAYIGSNGFKGHIGMKRNKKFTQLDAIKSVRKKMPKPTQIVISKKDKQKKNWDWRDELCDDEEDFSLPWEKERE